LPETPQFIQVIAAATGKDTKVDALELHPDGQFDIAPAVGHEKVTRAHDATNAVDVLWTVSKEVEVTAPTGVNPGGTRSPEIATRIEHEVTGMLRLQRMNHVGAHAPDRGSKQACPIAPPRHPPPQNTLHRPSPATQRPQPHNPDARVQLGGTPQAGVVKRQVAKPGSMVAATDRGKEVDVPPCPL